ncbi:LeuA family protein [Archangium sp.]|uniref:LeuA family protein n=1 Tax=Archangium sp. TaxID=1872627 RepID=UPI002D2EAAA5|nr:LeuA family protein [Archangium sp.]HYO56835.1 LeuA family protein [Archangium sp.]
MRRSAKESRPDNEANLIFEWDQVHLRSKPNQPFELVDESMRDGVQSPSVTAPSLADKLELLELMADLGIQVVDIGLPGAGKRAFDEVVALAKHIAKRKLELKVYCAARTHLDDIKPIAEAQQKAGMPIAVYTFIGSSPIRQWVEGWDIDFLVKTSSEAIDFAVKEGLEVGYVTEDTTRSSPATLERLFRSAVEHGASRLVLCDTVGHATPEGTRALVAWTRNLIASMDVPHVKIDWHGHNDRGFALANSITALEAGAHRVHGCGLGIGERVGNTPLDLLLLNLKLMGWIDNELSQLVRYVRKVSEAMSFPVPRNYPLSGEDAFRTATGVHAAAIIKAQKRGDDWLADRVYSGVPAGEFGKEQVIEISHMSGMSNVRYWLEKYLIPATDELCTAILQRAKNSARTLTDDEIFEVCARFSDRPEARRRVGAAG